MGQRFKSRTMASPVVWRSPLAKNENPRGTSPGGPTSSATSLPPVHPRSAARSRATAYI